MIKEYIPIDCSFHDVLLDRATRKKKVLITYQANDQIESTEGIIKDVYTKNKEEFLVLNDGTIIRLDFLLKVDGEILPIKKSCDL